MKSAGAEVHHYDVTNDDKLFAEFLKAQMSMGSLNTAAFLIYYQHFCKYMPSVLFRCHARGTNRNVAILALKFAILVIMLFTIWINEG